MPVSLLAVEDDPFDLKAVMRYLQRSQLPFDLQHVETIAAAREAILGGSFDCVLLDHHLPDGDSLDLLSSLGRKVVEQTPIIIVTGSDDETIAVKALRLGAQDYLVKTRLNLESLVRSIQYSIERHRFRDEAELQSQPPLARKPDETFANTGVFVETSGLEPLQIETPAELDPASFDPVLIVEDEVESMARAALWLSKAGFPVLTATSCSEALKILESRKLGLVLLDIVMPGLDGIELYHRIRQKREVSGLPIMFLTMAGGNELPAGDEFLSKPFTGEELLRSVIGLLGREAAAVADAQIPWEFKVRLLIRSSRGSELLKVNFSVAVAYAKFCEKLAERQRWKLDALQDVLPRTLYPHCLDLGLGSEALAMALARFLRFNYFEKLPSEAQDLGQLSIARCARLGVLPLGGAPHPRIVLSNPFEHNLLQELSEALGGKAFELVLASPGNLQLWLQRAARRR